MPMLTHLYGLYWVICSIGKGQKSRLLVTLGRACREEHGQEHLLTGVLWLSVSRSDDMPAQFMSMSLIVFNGLN